MNYILCFHYDKIHVVCQEFIYVYVILFYYSENLTKFYLYFITISLIKPLLYFIFISSLPNNKIFAFLAIVILNDSCYNNSCGCGSNAANVKMNTAHWSSGLRHRPLTADTGVRIPYGSPEKSEFRKKLAFFWCLRDLNPLINLYH